MAIRPQSRSQQTREAILERALQMFAASGFDGVGIREMAAGLGVNHALISYHFGNKEALWREAVRFLFDRIGNELSGLPDPTVADPVARAREYLRGYVRYCARHPEHARIMMQESVRETERIAWASRELIRSRQEPLFAMISDLIAAGALPDVPHVHLIYAISAAAQAPFTLAPEIAHTHGIDMMSACEVEAYADTIVALFLRTPISRSG